MARTLILLGLCACGYAQLIYPDQYETMRAAAYPAPIPTSIPTYPSDYRGSRVETPAYAGPANVQYSNNPSLSISGQGYYSPPPAAALAAPNPNRDNNIAYQSVQGPEPTGYSASSLAPFWSEHVNSIISKGITKFALDVQRELYNTNGVEENIVFSPLNIAMALAMVLLGSAGRTFEEVSKVLGLEAGIDISRHSEVVHQMFGLLLNRVEDNIIGSPGPQVNIASGVFVQDGYSIRPEFKSVSENVYRSEVINLDFQNQPRVAQNAVNSWVKEKTMQKISQILNDAPDRATKVILVSALYFNGEWNQHFMRGATKRRPFFVEPSNSLTVDLMYNGGTFQFYEDKALGAKIVRLPYKGQDTAMYVVLPSTPGATALRDFQNRLTAEKLENLISNMKNETCIIGMPRMKISNTWSLRRTLRSLGLQSLFDASSADLSLISQGYNRQTISPPQTTVTRPRDTILTVPPMPITMRPGKNNPVSQLAGNNDLFIFPRFGENAGLDGSRRNYFAYEDKTRGLSVQQWATGFSIMRAGRQRRQDRNPRETPGQEPSGDPASFYAVENQDSKPEHTKIVSAEEKKYRFESKPEEENKRRKRQSRQMDEDFLKYISSLNLPSYGLDELRNSATLINPGLYAADVLHKVEIEVTETGTEAAATTAVILERDGNQKRLIANRPFLFFIRHDPTKLMMFWGTVNKPTPNYPPT